jgi:NAD+ kinase
MLRRIGVTFNPRLVGARELAYKLNDGIRARGIESWVEDQEAPEDDAAAGFGGSDLIICLGGDGTVLRCARLVTGTNTLILGVNMGRLGFLTEIDGSEALGRLDEVLSGAGRIEERTMLRASVPRTGDAFHGLNEAVVGRATLSRAIQLAVDVDGTRIADYRCDGVIVASASGSTAYALSVGGPILHPESRDLVIVPVAPHLAAQHAVVLPGTETVHITLEPRQQAVLSVDGESDLELTEGDSVLVSASEHTARFLRLQPRSDFYLRMAAQLGWHRPGGNARPLPAVENGQTGKRANGQGDGQTGKRASGQATGTSDG